MDDFVLDFDDYLCVHAFKEDDHFISMTLGGQQSHTRYRSMIPARYPIFGDRIRPI